MVSLKCFTCCDSCTNGVELIHALSRHSQARTPTSLHDGMINKRALHLQLSSHLCGLPFSHVHPSHDYDLPGCRDSDLPRPPLRLQRCYLELQRYSFTPAFTMHNSPWLAFMACIHNRRELPSTMSQGLSFRAFKETNTPKACPPRRSVRTAEVGEEGGASRAAKECSSGAMLCNGDAMEVLKRLVETMKKEVHGGLLADFWSAGRERLVKQAEAANATND